MGSSKLRILAGLVPFLAVALAFGLQERSLRHALEIQPDLAAEIEPMQKKIEAGGN